jgi:adenosylhomocysteine nucleosidase
MFLGDKKLLSLAKEAVLNINNDTFDYHMGRIVTGDHFINSNKEKIQIISKYDPHCVEMEGGAIGHVSSINDIPFLVIRSISDGADDDATKNYEEFESVAANRSASIVIEIVKGL